MPFVDPIALQIAANADPEFGLAARYWTATLALAAPGRALRVEIADGRVVGCAEATRAEPATITITAPDAGWNEFLAPVPRAFYQDLLGGCVQHHGFPVAGDMLALSAYYHYTVEHDLAADAGRIDTKKTALHVLTGEYDWSSTPAMGQALANAVPGATFGVIPRVGHFPMSENPARFREHLMPLLRQIREVK